MSDPPRFSRMALVAAADARLRQEAFDRLAALGYRVDAVGDARALARRLAKDHYDLVLTDTLEPTDLPDSTRLLTVDPEILDRGDELERLVTEDESP